MKFVIRHEIRGRMRIHLHQRTMSFWQSEILFEYLRKMDYVTDVRIYERTCDAAICFFGDREILIEALRSFHYPVLADSEESVPDTGRKLNARFRDKLLLKVLCHYGRRLLLPRPVSIGYTIYQSLKYIYEGVCCLARGKIEVPVLDAAAIGVSIIRRDFKTANSVMFLLGTGELLEQWTHKKSVGDLARSMSLNIHHVWLLKDGQEILVPAGTVNRDDEVVVHMGNVIPFDGIVTQGEAMVNQSSMTGESVPVHKRENGYVYAGTVVEEGGLTIRVQAVLKGNRYEKIAAMIEASEKLKSSLEGKAEHLADRLVPYTLVGSMVAGLLTGSISKALAVLMVDFSCAMKLAMPIAVLSAIREAGTYHITVKGGKFLEAAASADTIVFDKTGTLTNARPVVKKVVTFGGREENEMLRIAACLEEHFPHSMARAVVDAAKTRHLEHEEMHSKVDYIVAHGISSFIEDKKVIIGSYHFVFEDEKCRIPFGEDNIFCDVLPGCSYLYLAIDCQLAAIICIEDPLREEAPEVIQKLRKSGIKNIVMMTGDSEKTASAIAARVGIDEYYSEVLPEDKAHFVKNAAKKGGGVIMVGDGINDSPALSAASVGIAVSDGAQIAREIADITISADNLWQIVIVKEISMGLMKRIRKNYRAIVGINAFLIILGITGIMPPAMSALMHNMTTLGISLKSMKNLLPEDTLL